VAEDLCLDWHAVKEMDKLYMREQVARAGEPRPGIVGIDELSLRKGHVYRILVSDLERQQPIWFGGVDRSAESMAMFYDFLGEPRTQRIRLAVMDMWKPFRTVTEERAPQAAILYDKFHVLRHLNEARDKVRKAEYQVGLCRLGAAGLFHHRLRAQSLQGRVEPGYIVLPEMPAGHEEAREVLLRVV
jgi:transposase